MAQFGLTEQDAYSTRAMKGYLFDQYVRACGYVPKGSWAFVVLPDGTCEYTQLQPGEPLWCCENRAEIAARVATPTTGIPPWADDAATRGSDGP